MNIKYLVIGVLVLIIIFRINLNGGVFKQKTEEVGIVAYFSEIGRRMAFSTADILPDPESGLLSGMVLGVGDNIPSQFKTVLKRTGTIHIVVVSGQNLTLLAGFIMSLSLYIGRKKTLFLTLFIVIFYSFITGFQIPVIRAGIMFLFVSVAQFFNREIEGWWVLTLTALGMLVFEPNWLVSVSFQLSVAATFGVIVVAPVIIDRLNFLPEIVKEDFGVSLAASLMTLPIIATNFSQVSLIAPIVNPLVLWTVSPIMISGAAAMIIYLINPFLGTIAGLFPGVLLTYFVYVVDFFNQFGWASIYVPRVSWVVWLGYYLLLGGIWFWLSKSSSSSKFSK